jgi:glycosyltransferase involved in cell wall biosynthesis
MRILLIGGDGGRTGVPRYLMQMVRALRDLAEITVLSDMNEGGFDGLTNDAQHIVIAGLRTSRSPRVAIGALLRLRNVMAAEPFDLVWAHSRMAVLLLRLLLMGRRSLHPTVFAITHHSLPFEHGYPQPYATLLRWWEGVMIRITRPHHIFFLTHRAMQRYCDLLSVSDRERHHLHVLESCSDLDPIPATLDPQGARVLIMTGRHSHQKNLPAALRLFAHLPKIYRLVICGPGTDQPAFQQSVADILTPAQQARVDLLGPLQDIRPELAKAAAYVLTSRYEGLPLGAREAWEAGLPVAMVKIDGTSGILARHPLATALGRDASIAALMQDAQAIDHMVDQYLGDPDAWRRRIKDAWAQHHAFDPWEERLRSAVQAMIQPVR